MVTACKQVYVIHPQHQLSHFMLWNQQKQKHKKNFFVIHSASLITELRKHGTTELRIYGTTELWKNGSTEARKNGTTDLRNHGITEERKNGTTELRKYGSWLMIHG
jgi:hypothetical protein